MGKDDSRQKILDAAGPIFASKGYQGTTIREICEVAGVNVASVNYYFRGKEQLYSEILDQLPPLKLQKAQPFAGLDESLPPEKQLRVIIRMILERILSEEKPSDWQFQLLHRELAHPSEIGRERIREFFVTHYERLIRIVGQLCPEGTPRSSLIKVAFSTVSQCLYYGLGRHILQFLVDPETREKDFTVDLIYQHITSFIFAGLGLAPSPFASEQGASTKWPGGHIPDEQEVKP